jgi:glycosyltransferase involved in cell wall biosynthesis
MNPIFINGNPWCDLLTGSERYAIETIRELDTLLADTGIEVFLLLPKKQAIPSFHNIKIIHLKSNTKGKLSLFAIQNFLRKNKGVYVGLTSNFALKKNAVIALFDVRPLWQSRQESELSIRDIFRFASVAKWNAIFCKKIVTISETTAYQIRKKLGVKQKSLAVTPCGFEHILRIVPNTTIFGKHPNLAKGEYFYSLSSIAPHKNFKWVLEVAKRNPQRQFAIAGNAWTWFSLGEVPENVCLVGRVSDEENVALMQNCKAFLFPSKFEGFGIPPLEAIALGAKALCADIPVLREIYDRYATFFGPDDYDVDLEALLAQPVNAPEPLLQKYSWKNTAKAWLEILRQAAEEEK